ESDTRIQEKLETKVWDPDNQLKDPQIDQFLVVARAVGTFARALDCSSSIRQPSLHMSAAAASRDITLFHAMDTLQKNGYDLAKAMSTLVPQGGPVLCRDEMEEWSASEAMLFEEALEKYGKDFNDIRQDFLPWKSLASVVQFYYITKPNPNQIMAPGNKPGMNGAAGFQKGLSCESCHMQTVCLLLDLLEEESTPRGHMTRQEVQGLSPFTTSGGRAKLLAKNRQTFILQTTKLTRIARRAPLKLKAPRGAPTPINRNQANQPRGGSGLLGKRPFDSSSVIKRQKVNQGDAPNPVVFVATKDTRALRKHLTQSEMRRAARKPHLPVRVKLPLGPRPLVLPIMPSSTSEPIVLED
ncbi:unnamed protein product, partial [Coregonus sp. 'balchen']